MFVPSNFCFFVSSWYRYRLCAQAAQFPGSILHVKHVMALEIT